MHGEEHIDSQEVIDSCEAVGDLGLWQLLVLCPIQNERREICNLKTSVSAEKNVASEQLKYLSIIPRTWFHIKYNFSK